MHVAIEKVVFVFRFFELCELWLARDVCPWVLVSAFLFGEVRGASGEKNARMICPPRKDHPWVAQGKFRVIPGDT